MSEDKTRISDPAQVRDKQYANSERLAARARLHTNYSIAKEGWFEWVAKRFGIAPGDRVLDVGCGPAWFWAAAAPGLPDELELTLVDVSPGMVSEAMGRAGTLRNWTVRGETANAQSLPFADASFDVVIAMHMLYHVPDQERAIAEMHRVLKPGGRLAVTTNGSNNMRALYTLTTAFGSAPTDPAAGAFGFERASQLIGAQFGDLSHEVHPSGMRITEPEDVFLALTSYPPGDAASEAQLAAFRAAIDRAFAAGNGVLEVTNEMGVFVATKP
jgi:ubiquinone/menaquinone biosynthesis C-methylase UbiE